jgi:hypothetical protein
MITPLAPGPENLSPDNTLTGNTTRKTSLISDISLFAHSLPSYKAITGSETLEDPLERSSNRRLRLSTPQVGASSPHSRQRTRSDSTVYSRRQVWHRFTGMQSFDWSHMKAALPDIENLPFRFQMEQQDLSPPNEAAKSKESEALEPQPFRFMDLPSDVRKMIYNMLYKWDRNVKFDVLQRTQQLGPDTAPPSTYGPPCPVALFQTNKDLLKEASDALYGGNTFEFTHGPSFTSFLKLQGNFGFPITTAREFLRHVIARRMPVPQHVLLQEKFASYFADAIFPLRFFNSLLDYSISLEVFQAYRRGRAVRFLSAFLDFWKGSCDTGMCGYELFELSQITFVQGKWRGIWLADADAWTLCVGFHRNGYNSPKWHAPPVELLENSHGRWTMERFEVKGVECALFLEKVDTQEKEEQRG